MRLNVMSLAGKSTDEKWPGPKCGWTNAIVDTNRIFVLKLFHFLLLSQVVLITISVRMCVSSGDWPLNPKWHFWGGKWK